MLISSVSSRMGLFQLARWQMGIAFALTATASIAIGGWRKHTERYEYNADGQVVRRFRGKRGAGVTQAFFADLYDAPCLGVAFFVKFEDVRVTRPVEEASVGHHAAQRRTEREAAEHQGN